MTIRFGAFWTESDLRRLKRLIDEGRTIPEIARELSRSLDAVRLRITKESWYVVRPRAKTRKSCQSRPDDEMSRER